MPYVESKDPTTGLVTREYVAPTASATPTAPKPVAAPAPTFGLPDIGGAIKNLAQGPAGLVGRDLGIVGSGIQELVKTGDVGKALRKGSAAAITELEKSGSGVGRMAYSAVRNTAQELSDVGTEAIAKIQGKPSPTSAKRPDAPFLGIMPPLPKAKSSGPAEDLAVGIGQFALSWIPVAKGVGLVGKGLSMLPGASKVAGATQAVTQAVKATKAVQQISKVPGAAIVGKSIVENTLTKAAATGGVIDFAAFDQYEGRLTDLLEQMGPLKHLAIDYLKSDPKDVGLDGRFKNVLEGALFGTGLEVAFRTFKAVRATRAVQGAPTEAKKAQLLPIAVAANNDLETAVIRQQTILPPIAPSPPVLPRTAVQPMGDVAAAAIERPLVKPGAELSHGTSEPARKSILAEGFRASEYERSGTVAGEGVYMTLSERYAGEYGSKRVGGALPEDAKILSWTGSNQTLASLADEIGIAGPRELNKSADEVELNQAQQQQLKQWALDNGYDGIQYRTNFTPGGKAQEVVIYNIDLANRIVGSKAAAAIEPPTPLLPGPALTPKPAAVDVPAPTQVVTVDNIVLPDTAFRKLTNAKANSAAEAYRSFYNAGQTPENQITAQQALQDVRAKGQRFVADGVPGLDIDQALRDMQIGRFTPEVEKLRHAYIEAYYPEPRAVLPQTPAAIPAPAAAMPPTAALSPAPLDLPPAPLDPQAAPFNPADMPPMPGDGGDLPPLPPDGGDLPPLPPEPPENVIPPAFDDAWTERLMKEYAANKEALDSGEIEIEDLLENNVQRFESRSGATTYVPTVPEEAVTAYRAFSDAISRVELTGINTMNLAAIEERTGKWLKSHNYNAKAIFKALKPLSGELANYERNLTALKSLAYLTDDRNYKAGIAANKFLNAQADDSSNMGQLIAELLTAAAEQKLAVGALEGITRPIGQLLYSLQGKRPQPGTLSFTNMDVGADIEKWLTANEGIPIDESIGKALSPEAEQAIRTGEYGSAKVMQELDQLARGMAQTAVTPGFAKGFWAQMNKAVAVGSRGLVMLRASQLLSSGNTMWRNVLGGVVRLIQLPVASALGAGLKLDFDSSGQALMMYGQYAKNLYGAYQLTIESFKAGRGLYDLDDTTIDFLDRAVRQDALARAEQGAMLEQGAERQYQGSGEWTLSTTPWLDVQDRSTWAMAQKVMWQALNVSTRSQVALDTFFKVLAGSSFEYVRNLEPGLKRALDMGIPKGSEEAWLFAQDYAQSAVDLATNHITLQDRSILDAVMSSPHAQTAMRYVTFTDDIMAEFEPGSAMAKAGEEIPFFARTFSAMPLVWQNLINLAPVFSIIQPFNRTPGDVVKGTARMTPLTAPLVDTFWRDINSADPMTRYRATGDVALGTATIGLVVLGMSQGYVEFVGGGPQDPAAKQKWALGGKIPYSFRVRIGTDENDMPIYTDYISMSAFDPFSNLIGAVADYIEIANKLPKEAREQLGSGLTMDLLTAVAAGQLNRNYYQGFAEFYEALTGLGEMEQGPNKRNPLEKYIARLVVSLTPFSAALRAARRSVDPYMRVVEPSNVEGGLAGMPMRMYEEISGEFKNIMPGWSATLPPRLNWITGQPIVLSGILGDQFLPPEYPWMGAVMQLMPWSPVAIAPKIDPVMQEMAFLHGKGAQFKGPTAEDWGKQNRLSPREYNKYIELTAYVRDNHGRNLYQALKETMESKHYRSLPQQEISSENASARATVINTLVSNFKQRGKQLYENENPALARQLDYIDSINKDVQYRAKYGQPTLSGFVETLR